MKYVSLILILVLSSGCLCCSSLTGDDKKPEELVCNPPYMEWYGKCCIDSNQNGICDIQEEDQMKTTSTTTTLLSDVIKNTWTNPTTTSTSSSTTQLIETFPPTTTVVASPTCADNIQNQKETYIDCGGPCTDCDVLEIRSKKEFKNTGYTFRYLEKKGVDDTMVYTIEVQTPDGIKDIRPISTGESFVDYLRLKVINYGEDPPKLKVQLNREDLSNIPSQASLLTIGGQSCSQANAGMCEREFAGYTIRNLNRVGVKGANLKIAYPDGVVYKAEVTSRLFVPDTNLVIEGFFDKEHYIQGGYNLFAVWQR